MELYETDLKTLLEALPWVEEICKEVPGVFGIEIRVEVLDTNVWAVLGFGETGDPCVLRFEVD